jgi:putative Holliday junction resolvase
MQKKSNLLGIDVGEKRVGLAIVANGLSIPRPLLTLANNEDLLNEITSIISEREIDKLVLGLPRNLSGEETPQTAYVRDFAKQIQSETSLPIVFQDEALTSVQAKQSLSQTGKPYEKGDVDSLAACTILSDYLGSEES